VNFNAIKHICISLFAITLMAGCESSSIPSIEQMLTNEKERTTYILPTQYKGHRGQQRVFSSTGGNIAYLDYGQGQVLVMLHGVPTSSWLYRKMIAALQGDYRVIAIDMLGFGSSDKPKSANGNYLPSNQADYIRQLLQHLNVTGYSLMFHDMGGLVAWELISDSIESKTKPSVSNLVVLNTIIDQQGFNHPNLKKGLMTRVMSDAFANQLTSAAVLEKTFDNMGLTANVKLSENICNGYVIPMKEGNGDVLYDFYTSFTDTEFASLRAQVGTLSEFDGDIMVLWGAEDKVLTTAQIPVLQKSANIKQANITIYQNNAHFLPEEIPDKLSARIRGFLN